jgi:hypothetical protein
MAWTIRSREADGGILVVLSAKMPNEGRKVFAGVLPEEAMTDPVAIGAFKTIGALFDAAVEAMVEITDMGDKVKFFSVIPCDVGKYIRGSTKKDISVTYIFSIAM